MRTLLTVLVLAALASPATAQDRLGEMGFEVTSPSGGTAGDFCWGVDCVPRPLAVRAGESLRLTVRAPHGAPFVVVFSTAATSCLRIPGVWNQLVVDPPLISVIAGRIDLLNQTRVCYDGYAARTLTLPATLPSGFRFALQAVAAIGTPPRPATGFGMSSAVLMTLR